MFNNIHYILTLSLVQLDMYYHLHTYMHAHMHAISKVPVLIDCMRYLDHYACCCLHPYREVGHVAGHAVGHGAGYGKRQDMALGMRICMLMSM